MIFEAKSYDIFDSKRSVMGPITHSDHIVSVPIPQLLITSHQTVAVKKYDFLQAINFVLKKKKELKKRPNSNWIQPIQSSVKLLYLYKAAY